MSNQKKNLIRGTMGNFIIVQIFEIEKPSTHRKSSHSTHNYMSHKGIWNI